VYPLAEPTVVCEATKLKEEAKRVNAIRSPRDFIVVIFEKG
jgi:hypothetical protein